MATEKAFQSGLPELLTQLLGTTRNSSTETTSNTAPLQQVFNQASQPMNPQLYQQLINSIFTQASQNVPTLTAALANSTGSRTRGNSALSLALNQQNNEAANAAAAAILAQNNKQAEIAGNAARGISEGSRTANISEKAGTGGSPGLMMLGGLLLNQADKRGWIDKAGNAISDFGSSIFTSNTGPDLTSLSSVMPSMATGFGGAGADAAVGGFSPTAFTDPLGDFISTLGTGNDVAAATTDTSLWDTVSDGASSAWDTVSNWFGFADGGMTTVPQARNLIRTGQNRTDAALEAAMAGRDPNLAVQEMLQQIMAPKPQPMDPTLMDFLLGIINKGAMGAPRPPAYNGPTPAPAPTGYADGGRIRNRNYMGAPEQMYGMNALTDFSMPVTGAGGPGISSELLTSLIMSGELGRNTGGNSNAGEGYQGKVTDKQFSDMKYTRDVFGGFAPGELSTIGKMIGLAANPSVLGFAKFGYDANKNDAITQNAVDFANAYQQTPDQQSAQEAEQAAREADAISFMQQEAAATGGGGSRGEGGYGGWNSNSGGETSGLSGGVGGVSNNGTSEGSGGYGGYGTAADGGLLSGPGTGTSDSIVAPSKVPGVSPVRLSNKEFIMPADVVAVPGMLQHFQSLLNAYHTPVRR